MPLSLADFERGLRDYWVEIGRRSPDVQARERAFPSLAGTFTSRNPPHFTRQELELIIAWKYTDGRRRARAMRGLQQLSDQRIVELTRGIATMDGTLLLSWFRGAIA